MRVRVRGSSESELNPNPPGGFQGRVERLTEQTVWQLNKGAAHVPGAGKTERHSSITTLKAGQNLKL